VVQAGGDHPAVAEGKGGRAVPRLIQTFVVLVESADIFRKVILRAEGGGDEHEHGIQRAAAGDGEEFESVIQAGGVAAPGLNDRVEQREIGRRDAGAGEVGLSGADPVAVPEVSKAGSCRSG